MAAADTAMPAPAGPPSTHDAPASRRLSARAATGRRDRSGGGDGPAGESGWRDRVRAVVGHGVLAGLSLFCIFPIYWMYATSLRRPDEVYNVTLFPWPLSIGNYTHVTDVLPMGQLILNTFLVALAVAVGQMLVGLLAAYAFTAWKFRGQTLLYLAFVGTWLVPFQVTMLPNYTLLYRLGLLNVLPGVIIPNLVSALGVLLLRQHMASFPRDLIDAARIDGRSAWSILWTVIVPNLRAPLAALAIVLFINAWNDYFWPALVLQRAESVVQLGLRGLFVGVEGPDWGGLMAGSGLACLPIFAIYLMLQRHVVSAFVRSGLK
ncbi:carbohydrate ABC transporter permease [Parafrankia sp. EUN1f]|uniref:carbohydrate ABC transporter permease n=1 Tax=Parafrankia sp. EUN1f TaxID=102897 RepID=UPI0001C46838|nr:carbohydrate ABC transporter permease [Parafrankia sp. EUN1f]EFC80863.1 binding-protein-dependent transport systems inner membrane component [Parafrankia sp. EUN1f]